MRAPCLQCSVAGVERQVPYFAKAMDSCGQAKQYWFKCSHCKYGWTYDEIAIQMTQEKEKARIAALCALTSVNPLNADMREKIIREAGLL